jgi:hypothetical protein
MMTVLQGAHMSAYELAQLNIGIIRGPMVWGDLESLSRYVYHSDHVQIMRRRREWFEKMGEAFLVLWWVPKGHRPSIEEAKARLEVLRRKGPSAEAFTFRQPFPPPDAPQAAPRAFGDECPAA